MREIKSIVVHCSDSEWGDAKVIKEWHKERGFSTIGYHHVILNCYPTQEEYTEGRPNIYGDGSIEEGREEKEVGAHAIGFNKTSIGICLIGKRNFTSEQIDSLKKLIYGLQKQYGLNNNDVFGHYELSAKKTCPNLDMRYFRTDIL